MVMDILDGIDECIAKLEKVSILLVLCTMVLVGFTGVVYRYLFLSSIVWIDELVRNLVLWFTCLGASLATKYRNHLKIDIFPLLLKGRAKIGLEIVLNLAACIICLFLLITSWDFVSAQRELGEILYFVRIPMWIAVSIVPIAFAVITFRFGLDTIRSFIGFLKSERV